MTKEETKKIVDKVQIYRQSFLITNEVYQEWFKKLEPYDYEDVDRKLDDYFEDNDNRGRYPDPIYLTKYLIKSEDKLRPGIMYLTCNICNKKIEMNKFDMHYDKCSSIEYICKNYKKYYNKEIDKNALLKLSKTEFETKYWKFCETLVDKKCLSENEKMSLENAILTHYGNNPCHDIDEILRKDDKND